MQNENTQIAEMQAQIASLRSEIESINQLVSKNNFSSSQTFSKAVIFSTRMRVPVFSSAPSVGEVGDLIAVGGVLYICTTAGNVASPAVFSLVGTQS
jgi:hypothetical protein